MKTIIICFLLMTSATSSAQLQHYDLLSLDDICNFICTASAL